LDSEVGYEHFIMKSDGESLIGMLKYGLRYRELLLDRTLHPTDWHKSDWRDA
jgi:hypothetical protein